MRPHARERTRADDVLEVICVLVVVAAVAALLAWIVLHSGGGVLNQG